ncbi:MAG: hypothetical protein LBP22_06185 [Deltaproteobacteria bacterium]|nr:hypothetical protein [Deltaproteobacteria bacterium]
MNLSGRGRASAGPFLEPRAGIGRTNELLRKLSETFWPKYALLAADRPLAVSARSFQSDQVFHLDHGFEDKAADAFKVPGRNLNKNP